VVSEKSCQPIDRKGGPDRWGSADQSRGNKDLGGCEVSPLSDKISRDLMISAIESWKLRGSFSHYGGKDEGSRRGAEHVELEVNEGKVGIIQERASGWIGKQRIEGPIYSTVPVRGGMKKQFVRVEGKKYRSTFSDGGTRWDVPTSTPKIHFHRERTGQKNFLQEGWRCYHSRETMGGR